MKNLFFILFFTFSFTNITAQIQKEVSPVKWLDIQTVDSLVKKHPKPILIDVYTQWCGWCKVMMKNTYGNKQLASYINAYFYPVRFDAESADTFLFQGKKYIKPPKSKVNQLATELLNGRYTYPSTIFYSRDLKQKYNIAGYLKIHQIEPLLVYFAEDLYTTVGLNRFQADYMLAFPKVYQEELTKEKKQNIPDTSGKINWLTIDKAIELNKKNPKKILLFTYVSWCYSCNIMKKTPFRDSVVASLVNKYFYPVWFDVTYQKNITINGQTYKSLGKGQPHQFAMKIFKGGFRFPSTVFLDSNFNTLSIIAGYYSAYSLKYILAYFATDAYKTKSYQRFVEQNKNKW